MLQNDGTAPIAASFAGALLRPNEPVPQDITSHHGAGLIERYNVYRNNVTVSLINAVASIYPAVQRITGEDFFRAMARFYIRAHPPRSPLLFAYGREFPDFIEAYEYASSMPWLADVARIERAWLDAYHAADAAHLAPDMLSEIAPEGLGALRFRPHPATRILRSAYPAVTIFSMNHNGGEVSAVEDRPEDALVTRRDDEVMVTHLDSGAADFLQALIAGETLGTAAALGLEANPNLDLSRLIAVALDAGAFSSLDMETSHD
ncbi:HvfC/BufC N-terminal domain-containing protein [Rhizobium oryzicola]|uniref:DNA-binding domain-containing protein n=1 Tax=Rhizobium oryzicola TaxID=1232668 RepID=A0ABT8T1D3_9HYPH|nr:DNA-binding domain-containing protein [Rhizobium oryzicola]MDO1584345.1 DNA-binding domain-containing protein [Rhizobium oryzicola]